MRLARSLGPALGLAAAFGVAGCFTAQKPMPPAAPPVPDVNPPAQPSAAADAVPRVEPRSRYGNPPFYDVFGKRYYVLASGADYVERGVASWYGPGFHKIRTSTGEPYDMYGMTAAHRTLPLPAYVRVTNLQNGRSVVVRVNDRGPFVANRIIDLSYTAASRLDMLRNGTAMVEVRAIDPAVRMPDPAPLLAQTSPAPASTTAAAGAVSGTVASTVTGAVAGTGAAARAALYVQAGAFSDPANADRLAARLRGGDYGKIFIRDDLIAGRRMYRVRIGPVPDVPEFDRIVAALEREGVHDAHLAME